MGMHHAPWAVSVSTSPFLCCEFWSRWRCGSCCCGCCGGCGPGFPRSVCCSRGLLGANGKPIGTHQDACTGGSPSAPPVGRWRIAWGTSPSASLQLPLPPPLFCAALPFSSASRVSPPPPPLMVGRPSLPALCSSPSVESNSPSPSGLGDWRFFSSSLPFSSLSRKAFPSSSSNLFLKDLPSFWV
jgi:hypothetical protein